MSSRYLNMVSPVNWQHPLNRGLNSWWLCVPGLMGGSRLVDLCGRNHGTLTSMDPVTDWVGTNRPGGFGALDFDGTGDHVVCANTSQPQELTLSAWVYQRTIAGTWSVIAAHGTGVASDVRIINNVAGDIRIDVEGRNSGPQVTGQNYTVDTWQHYILTSRSGRTVLYLNGRAVFTGTANGTITYGGSLFHIGARGGGLNHNGRLDDVRWYNRDFSDAEAFDLYQTSKQSWNPTLNWIRKRSYAAVAAPPATNRLLNLRRRACA